MISLALSLALVTASPVALRVEVQPLGHGSQATVVGVGLQVAPEDRARVGDRVSIDLVATVGGKVVDRGEAVVALQGDGSALLYRELPSGDVRLVVTMTSLDGQARGVWSGTVKVPIMAEPFEAPRESSPDAVALAPVVLDAPVVRFKSPPRLGGVGAVQLEMEVSTRTAKVVFYQDDKELVTRQRAPWTVSVSLGVIAHRTTVRAVAFDASGAILGEDALVLNAPSRELAVEVLLGPSGEGPAGRRVTVAVTPASAVNEVALKLDDRTIARWTSCPCVTVLSEADLKAAKVLSAEAAGREGLRGEAVKILGVSGFTADARVELVELAVTVLDRDGRLVTDLTRDDFKVLEDGQPVELTSFGRSTETPLSVAVEVDTSGSMKESFPAVRKAVGQFVSSLLRPGDSLMLATFSFEPTVQVPWTTHPGTIEMLLDRITPDGGTSLHDAVVRGLEQFRGRRGRGALVLLTDGDDTTSRTPWPAAVRFAQTTRIPVFPIGFKIGVLDFMLREHLKNLAASTGGEYFAAPASGDLHAVYAKIGEHLRSQYLLAYRSGATGGTDRFRTVTVQVGRDGCTARTIAGYYATQ